MASSARAAMAVSEPPARRVLRCEAMPTLAVRRRTGRGRARLVTGLALGPPRKSPTWRLVSFSDLPAPALSASSAPSRQARPSGGSVKDVLAHVPDLLADLLGTRRREIVGG